MKFKKYKELVEGILFLITAGICTALVLVFNTPNVLILVSFLYFAGVYSISSYFKGIALQKEINEYYNKQKVEDE